ncbi:MAG: glycoside hydrolase family 38 C-terminal domain-containing protein [Candidatus Odinarchaeota archaeon]
MTGENEISSKTANKDKFNSKKAKGKAIIVPSTHWDREWYLPFQSFRFKLVQLVDRLLDILRERDYRFLLDGQTIILEDYFEIRPERRDELLEHIRAGKIAAGPWYILPDEWLIGQESLIRNYEYSLDLANQLGIPLISVGYLPDMFGHTSAIPQLLADLTDMTTAILWRGTGPEIRTVPFTWKSSEQSTVEVSGIYLPFGYGNAADLPEEESELTSDLERIVGDLKPWSPVPVYLLMNGSDHLFPQPAIKDLLEKITLKDADVSIGLLDDYLEAHEEAIDKAGYTPPVYAGEFRSSFRAHLLQDTYSSRMWIKQWNQKIEDLLTRFTEPIGAYSWFYLRKDYPSPFLREAWKWHLRNQPHDSICGCSVDQTHEEMKSRYYWAESIATTIVDNFTKEIPLEASQAGDDSFLVYNPTNSRGPHCFELELPTSISLSGIQAPDGQLFDIQPLASSGETLFEMTLGARMLRANLKLVRGRRITNFYINEVKTYDGSEGTCEILILCDDTPVGDFKIEELKNGAEELVKSKKYKRYHVTVAKQAKQKYIAVAPLQPWGFTKLALKNGKLPVKANGFSFSKDAVENSFYLVTFNKDGSFTLVDKITGIEFTKLHLFEDWGDRGDEYTFGRLGPEKAEVRSVKRSVSFSGSVTGEIRQELTLEMFREIDSSRQKRTGRVNVTIISAFRFYRDLSRIDITTELVNLAKDHRLRICFDLPFKSSHTFTSTHFGCIKRPGYPVGDESFKERPSGIQPQKRFIRVEDQESSAALTLSNYGLPEVELVDGSKLALTLVRSIGYLSRADIPERPEHAGPYLETPGAQELFNRYRFKYSILSHAASDPLTVSADHSEASSLQPVTVFFQETEPPGELLRSLFLVDNPWIRVSSIRVRDDRILVTAFNLWDKAITARALLPEKTRTCSEIKINGSVKVEKTVENGSVDLHFEPHEIKIVTFA